MDDPEKVIVAVSAIVSITYVIRMIVNALLARRSPTTQTAPQGVLQLAEERMARLEHAVDAIAVEVERISEGQRFTTRLLSEQSRPPALAAPAQLSTDTPH
jgi:hypothetical protein